VGSFYMDYYFDMLEISTFPTTSFRPGFGKDPWSILGVPEGASPTLIKKAWIALAKQYHVDKLGHLPSWAQRAAMEEFQKVSRAHDLLSDPKLAPIFRKYGMEAFKVYQTGDTPRILKTKLRYQHTIGEPFISPVGGRTPYRDPVTHEYLFGLREEVFRFDPNSTENEGRWRLRDPKKISNYRRRSSKIPGISYIIGRDMKTGKSVVQAVRFNRRLISEKQAAAWWEKNKHRSRFRKIWTW